MNAKYYIEAKFDSCAWERIDEATTEFSAISLLSEYILAYGKNANLRIKHKGEIIFQ